MTNPSFILLYVDDPEASGAFYALLLGAEPVDVSKTFVLFALPSGWKLGLWSRHTAAPAAAAAGGGEIGFPVEGAAALEAAYSDWKARGLAILQEPTDMDFGRTFVALDPDGHRLRVFAPS